MPDLKALAAYGTCTISDALDRHGIDGVMSNLAPLWPGSQMVGWAMTMRLESVERAATPAAVHLGVRAIARAGQGGVVVIDNGARTSMGSWGGLLSRAAVSSGLAGVVTDGAVRDIDEAESLRLPAFGRGVAIRTARGRIVETSVGETISCDGVTVAVGDAIIGDRNGILRIPRNAVADVYKTATDLFNREQRMADALDAGNSVDEVLGVSYETMLRPDPVVGDLQ